MRRHIIIYILACWSAAAQAQQMGDTLSAWIGSGNAAGLSAMSSNVAEARLTVMARQGGLHNIHDARKSYVYGASVWSLYRLSPRTVVGGGMAYRHTADREAAGSVLTDPLHAPFNITETGVMETAEAANSAQTTVGDKEKDDYRLHGMVATDVGQRFVLGMGADYRTANYTKQKDPRHKNSYMDLRFSPGVRWLLATAADRQRSPSVGLNYSYRRTVEGLSFRSYGKQDRVYEYVIDYGAMLGRTEHADGMGYTDPSEEKPLVDTRHAIAAQLQLPLGRQWSWFASVAWQHRQGHYGERAQNTMSYTHHRARQWTALTTWELTTDGTMPGRHRFAWVFDNEQLTNYENVSRSITAAGGLTERVYYGRRLAGERQAGHLAATYRGLIGSQPSHCTAANGEARWLFSSAVDYRWLNRTAYVYPLCRKQETASWLFKAMAGRNLACRRSLLSLSAGLQWQTGSGTMADERSYDSNATAPATVLSQTADRLLHQEYEYLTASQLGVDLAGRYAFPMAAAHMRGYVAVGYGCRKAFHTSWLDGTMRHELNLSLGCNF